MHQRSGMPKPPLWPHMNTDSDNRGSHTPRSLEESLEQKPMDDHMPDPSQPVCRLMQAKLECHMSEFNPVQLKALEDSGQLQEFLEERASQARLIYLQCRKAGMSPLQAGEVANQDLYPPPEASEEAEEDPEE
jgi:hypothetical protein